MLQRVSCTGHSRLSFVEPAASAGTPAQPAGTPLGVSVAQMQKGTGRQSLDLCCLVSDAATATPHHANLGFIHRTTDAPVTP